MPRTTAVRPTFALILLVSCVLSVSSLSQVTITGSNPGSFQCTEGNAPTATAGSGCGSGTGGGDCSYATAVNATHGMH